MDNDLFSSLLSDPDALQNAMKTVSGMLGGSEQSATPPQTEYDPSAELMERALPVIGTIVQSGQKAVGPEKRALLNAMKPFVTDEVSTHFDHAMRLVSMARMARAALGQLGQRDSATAPEDGATPL